jgi:3-phosphoshikimate 1-carboxyvinyltransferase
MKRLATPLSQMGANIVLSQNEYAPVQIRGISNLSAIHYHLPIASAQLKSALLFAGLFCSGTTILDGKILSRDHTERLLPHFGVELAASSQQISIQGNQKLTAAKVDVPGDLSSAAFWIAASTLVPEGRLELHSLSLNPTRLGFIEVLKRMGAQIDIEILTQNPEPVGNLVLSRAPLQGTFIREEEIPSLIDEIPLIAILACYAEGTTTVVGAKELRVKETDRIEAIASNLRALGVAIDVFPDGFSIHGPQPLKSGKVHSFGDHRIAMAFSIGALRAQGPIEILETQCVNISYPDFYSTLAKLV